MQADSNAPLTRPRPVAGPVAALLFLGAITSIVVAWNSAIMVQARPGSAAAQARHVWVDERSGDVYSVFRTIGSEDAQRAYVSRIPKGFCTVMPDSVHIAWTNFDGTVAAENCSRLPQSPFPSHELLSHAPEEASWQVVIAGWPMSCLYWAIASEPQRPPVNIGVGFWDNKKVPTRPLITGFIVDSVLYALLWGIALWLIVRTVRFGRDWWRRKFRIAANLCRACGYDRTGLPQGAQCPECGAPAETA